MVNWLAAYPERGGFNINHGNYYLIQRFRVGEGKDSGEEKFKNQRERKLVMQGY